MTLSSGLRLSRDAARWGVRFYVRHFWIVLGLSLVPTVQRFVAVRWGQDLPAVVNIAAEILTGAGRVLLLYVILRLAIVNDPELRPLDRDARWERLGSFAKRRRYDVVVQFLVLGAAFFVLDVLPNLAIEHWVAEDRRELVASLLVSAKNPTVIAFTIVWMVGVARQMILSGEPREAADSPAGPDADR
ncbi:hypothetical protein GCM10022252_04820 [Streptosporangium oxazolinicum]|uniref:DUF2975 domain-containing protein n=1 Tax=Streptosporangium oxazolinicum TaxID=909287 RepID=A0ABP8ABF6_9ACTN